MTSTLRGACFSCALALPAFAQLPAAKPLAYDVVTVRENKSNQGMSMLYGRDTFTAESATLLSLIRSAYDLRSDQILGLPSWADSTHFDMKAKIVEADPETLKNLSQQQRRKLLQQVLQQRFSLKAHTETKEMPTYDLVPGKNGAKVQPLPTTQEATRSGYSMGNDSIRMQHGTMSMLAGALAVQVQRTVFDKTGLSGAYSFELKFAADPAVASTDGAPSIFTAVQEELGLRLQPSRGRVEVLVIDHADPPTSNDN